MATPQYDFSLNRMYDVRQGVCIATKNPNDPKKQYIDKRGNVRASGYVFSEPLLPLWCCFASCRTCLASHLLQTYLTVQRLPESGKADPELYYREPPIAFDDYGRENDYGSVKGLLSSSVPGRRAPSYAQEKATAGSLHYPDGRVI